MATTTDTHRRKALARSAAIALCPQTLENFSLAIAPHSRPAPGSALAAVVGQALARWKSTAAPDRSFGAQCQARSDSNGRSVHDLGSHRVVQVYFGLLRFDRDDQAVSNLIVESLLRYQGLPPSWGGVDTEYAQACQV